MTQGINWGKKPPWGFLKVVRSVLYTRCLGCEGDSGKMDILLMLVVPGGPN